MDGGIRLRSIVLECPDPRELGDFYQKLTGWPIVNDDDEWINVDSGGPVRLSFQRAPDHKPPTWPDPASSMQFHLDFYVDDLDTAEHAAVAVGARKHEVQPGDDFRVFTDPAGHLFCLCL